MSHHIPPTATLSDLLSDTGYFTHTAAGDAFNLLGAQVHDLVTDFEGIVTSISVDEDGWTVFVARSSTTDIARAGRYINIAEIEYVAPSDAPSPKASIFNSHDGAVALSLLDNMARHQFSGFCGNVTAAGFGLDGIWRVNLQPMARGETSAVLPHSCWFRADTASVFTHMFSPRFWPTYPFSPIAPAALEAR